MAMPLILIFIFNIAVLTGCGVYSFTGRGLGGIKSVAVEPFDNQTAEFGIREDLTDTILNRLLTDRTLTIADRASADAVLHGTLETVEDKPLTFSDTEDVSEYEVVITVNFILTKVGQGEPIWTGRISGRGTYPYKSGALAERENGIDKALDRIAVDLVNRLTSDW